MGKAQNGVPAGPAPVRVKGPGEEGRKRQARLGPHPVSIFSFELHHPELLAPDSQLALWSISRCRFLPSLGRDSFISEQKKTSTSSLLTVPLFMSSRLVPGCRTDISMPQEVGCEEMRQRKSPTLSSSSSCHWADHPATVPTGSEHTNRNSVAHSRLCWHEIFLHSMNGFTVTIDICFGLKDQAKMKEQKKRSDV